MKSKLVHRVLNLNNSSDKSDDSDGDDDDAVDEALLTLQGKAKANHYYKSRSSYRASKSQIIHDDLNDDATAWLNPLEFQQKYRMSREAFASIVFLLVKNHPLFLKKRAGATLCGASAFSLAEILRYGRNRWIQP